MNHILETTKGLSGPRIPMSLSIRQLSHIRSTLTRTLQASPIVIFPIGCPRSPPGHVTKCYWLVTLASFGIKSKVQLMHGVLFCSVDCPVSISVTIVVRAYSLCFLEHRVPGLLPPLRWCEPSIPSSDAYRTEELPSQRGWSALHMLLLTLHVGEQVYLK